jgi:MFS family permease
MTGARARQLLAIGLGTSVVPLDSAVNIAFPAITRGFGLAIGEIQWVIIPYALTYASLMLAFGRLGDLFGHARVFRAGLVCSTVAYLACALAPDIAWLVGFRILQGIGAALVLSCGAALTTALDDETRRARLLGIYTMMMALGQLLGPSLGGALVALGDWPAVFWFRVPIALAALVLLRAPARAARDGDGRFDAPGAALLVLALVGLPLTINRLDGASALPVGLAALAALGGFVWRELRTPQPIIDLRVFRVPGFAAITAANLAINLAGFVVWLLVPYYLGRAGGTGVALGGVVLAASSLGIVIASQLGGRLLERVAARRLALAGALLSGLGLWLVGRWQSDAGLVEMLLGLLVQGIGLGLFQLACADSVTATIARQDRGVAGSLVLVTRTVGIVGAASLMRLVFETWSTRDGFLPAFHQCFDLAALLSLATAVLLVPHRRSIG